MDFYTLIGLGFIALGLPNVYVGWWHLSGRGTPPWVRSNRLLLYYFAREPSPRRIFSVSVRYEGLIQVLVGLGFVLVGAYVVVTGFV